MLNRAFIHTTPRCLRERGQVTRSIMPDVSRLSRPRDVAPVWPRVHRGAGRRVQICAHVRRCQPWPQQWPSPLVADCHY